MYRHHVVGIASGICATAATVSIFFLLLLLQYPMVVVVVDGWTSPPVITTRATTNRWGAIITSSVPLPYQQQSYLTSSSSSRRWSRQSRLYSEPIVSKSSSSSKSKNSTSTTATATTATTTVLPFMATTQSVTTTTNKKTLTAKKNSDIPSSSSSSSSSGAAATVMDITDTAAAVVVETPTPAAATTTVSDDVEIDSKQQQQQQQASVVVDDDIDIHYMKIAIELAQLDGGEHGPRSAYPNPTVGAVLVSTDSTTGTSTIIGRGRSDYCTEAVRACMEDAGYVIAALSEWVVTYPIRVAENVDILSSTEATTITSTAAMDAATTNPRVRQHLTLYTTLEPSTRRRGTATPPVTNLIRAANIQRVVIGCPSPVPEKAMLGATALHSAGIKVTMMQDPTIQEECQNVIRDFTISSNCKLQRMARKHFQLFGRPLGFLHCSVIHSDNIEAFRRNGNAFSSSTTSATTAGSLSYRNFGTYALAPPPDNIWADTEFDTDVNDEDDNDDDDSGTSKRIDDEFVMIDFEEEDSSDDDTIQFSSNSRSDSSPMMPWYNQVDAVVGTFPRSGNGPPNDDSIMARLNGLKWLATHGNQLSAGVERILVLDATELRHLPLTNDDPNLPQGVDIESFWRSTDRKPVRLLLRRGVHEAARAAAVAASIAALAASEAAEFAANAIELGDATKAATAAIESANTALTSKRYIEQELETTQVIRRKLEDLGVIIETLPGGEPIDVMEHLGTRNGLYSVVWRAGCWGERGVRAILAGAFQWVSAHIAVPADGGRFWQLMMAENAVQGACGPQSKVKVFADQDDISMEYCHTDEDCVLSVDGKPIRHVRLDCRVALVDEQRPREFDIAKTQTMNHKVLLEQAPWFL